MLSHIKLISHRFSTMKVLLILLPLVVKLVSGQSPKPVYGPPKASGGGYTGGGVEVDGGASEPASYEFSYEVEDEKIGLNFGHKESREGETAQGSYHVLLPDGRTQRVDYVADQTGYMPKVIYEGEARPDSFGPPSGSGSARTGGSSSISGTGSISERGSTGISSGGSEGYRY